MSSHGIFAENLRQELEGTNLITRLVYLLVETERQAASAADHSASMPVLPTTASSRAKNRSNSNANNNNSNANEIIIDYTQQRRNLTAAIGALVGVDESGNKNIIQPMSLWSLMFVSWNFQGNLPTQFSN
jgi:hypothetical protein